MSFAKKIQEPQATLGKGEVGGSIPLGSTSFLQRIQRENCGPSATSAAWIDLIHQNITRIAQTIRAKSVHDVLISFSVDMKDLRYDCQESASTCRRVDILCPRRPAMVLLQSCSSRRRASALKHVRLDVDYDDRRPRLPVMGPDD
jgi:hypothetical protein